MFFAKSIDGDVMLPTLCSEVSNARTHPLTVAQETLLSADADFPWNTLVTADSLRVIR